MAAVRYDLTPGTDATTHQNCPAEVTGPACVLVVGDQPVVAHSVPACLRFAGYETHVARSGAEAMALSQRIRLDFIVLDTRLPDVDGLALARGIRRRHNRVPVLFLASMGHQPSTRGIGLTVGGDDYLAKPFSLDDVTARVRAGLRRANASDRETALLRFADLQLDEDTHVVRRAGQPVQLTPREREILRYLLVNAGRIVTRAHIHEHVWPYGEAANPRALDVHICTMRRKLDKHGPALIHTMHGVGYILRQPDGDGISFRDSLSLVHRQPHA